MSHPSTSNRENALRLPKRLNDVVNSLLRLKEMGVDVNLEAVAELLIKAANE